ncbi:aminotransferase class I/II-fold pyridoxal phosphate-dependent enzyme, partial [Microbacterium sp.]|uniref:aminotransferase class I/II-fold pyridoxal phosphate-dependent enzyme n=1 Tax=Microbacterium sp. TaxID=51671 RepID=UPI002630F255
MGAEELEAVKRVFESGWLSGAGPACLALERDFAEIAGVPDVLATSNCGAALHLSLLALGVRPGDEIIVGDYTFPATGHSVRWAGATPVFVDVRPDIWSIDPALIE